MIEIQNFGAGVCKMGYADLNIKNRAFCFKTVGEVISESLKIF